jgi:hypothetical protein
VVRGCGEAIRKKAFFRVCTARAPHRFGARLALGGRDQMLLLSQPSSGFWKTKKIISREKNNLPPISSYQKNWKNGSKKRFPKNSKKLPKLRTIRKRVALNEKNILQVRNK